MMFGGLRIIIGMIRNDDELLKRLVKEASLFWYFLIFSREVGSVLTWFDCVCDASCRA